MRKLLSMVLLITMILVVCMQNKQRESNNVTPLKTPPELTVTAGDKSITAVLGTYSWTIDNGDGTETNVQSDSEAPPALAKDQKESIILEPKSSIFLNFGYEPNDYIVNIWKDDNQSTQEVTNGEIIAPQQNGLIVYEVFAKWNEGTAYYAFVVNVDYQAGKSSVSRN